MKLKVFTIKNLMARNGFTGAALAAATGISRQTISTILNRGSCSIANAVKLANALEVELEAIVKED